MTSTGQSKSTDSGLDLPGRQATPKPREEPSPPKSPINEASQAEPSTPASQHEPDDEITAADDGDSAVGSLLDDDTKTLNSYVTNYRIENNRRYHNYGSTPYWGPNDEEANDNQDFGHHIYRLTLQDKLHLAPLTNPHRILDLGTGTGIWAIDMADLYPSAIVTGTDISPIQPSFVPPNCSFEVDDFNETWTYPDNYFDFIHGRELFGSVVDWDQMLRKMMVHTKPGGWVELIERSVWPRADDGTVRPDHFYNLWGQTMMDMSDKWTKTLRIWETAKERMIQAGFQNVTEVKFKWPMNHWPKDRRMKELGRWNQLRMHMGLENFTLRLLTMAGGWSPDEARIFCAQMRNAIKDTKSHAYLDVIFVYGQKPPVREEL